MLNRHAQQTCSIQLRLRPTPRRWVWCKCTTPSHLGVDKWTDYFEDKNLNCFQKMAQATNEKVEFKPIRPFGMASF